MSQPLPKKLEDALRDQPRYKPGAPVSPESRLASLLSEKGIAPPADDHSFERGLLKSILGVGRSSKGTSAGSGGGGLFPTRGDRSGRVLSDSGVNNAQNLHPDVYSRLRSPPEKVTEGQTHDQPCWSVAYSSDAACGSPRGTCGSNASADGGSANNGGSGRTSSSRGGAEAELIASMASRLARLEKVTAHKIDVLRVTWLYVGAVAR